VRIRTREEVLNRLVSDRLRLHPRRTQKAISGQSFAK
jgi:hypothetical protein